VPEWTVRVARPVVAAGRRHSLVLRRDGTVFCAGEGAADACLVQDWDDIVSVAAGNVHAAANTGAPTASVSARTARCWRRAGTPTGSATWLRGVA
jgi:hypothetical protein